MVKLLRLTPSLRVSLCVLVVLAGIFSSCSNIKHLPKGDRLFRGSKVVIKDSESPKKDRKVLRSDLAGVVRPRPNSKFLGARIKLGIYNFGGGDSSKAKGIRRWLRNKMGEPPVLASKVHLDVNNSLMLNLLQNRGYFAASVTDSMNNKVKGKSQAVFEVTTGPQYTINKVVFRRDSTLITVDIDSDFKETLLTPGSPYNLDVIKAERVRIDRMLKEKGYYYFKPDYILVFVDSNIGEHKVNMNVRLKHREIPSEAYRTYNINDIYIYANYRLRGKDQDTDKTARVVIDNYNVIDKRKAFKPQVFADAMIFQKGEQYSLDDQNTSLSRLVNLGTFKFVKNRFQPVGDNLLDVYYYLTPFPKKSLRFEIGALTQNDNRTGTNASISWRHRNAFKGAEELMFKVRGGIEVQYGQATLPDIYNLGAEISIAFPRFIVPFVNIQTVSRYMPRSIIKLKTNYETELTLLSILSFTGSYGYSWKESPQKEHQLYPINITYVKTDTLGNIDQLNRLYSSLIFNGIIFGPTYEFTYNSQTGNNIKSGFYFDGLIDLSGNLFGLAQKADYEKNPQTLFGVTYAQYIKLQPDFRYYFHLNNTSTIAARVLAGIGIPYGNSKQLPNIKQFWAGGNSDLRGFPSRLVGPGTFNENAVYKSTNYIQTLGDIKLEANLEYRRNLYKFINGALFAEAGNIWLYRDNPTFPGGTFTTDFYKQLAADVGAGLRFDFKILLLRLDFGFPVLKPWATSSSVPQPASNTLNNMVVNIAIGYPF